MTRSHKSSAPSQRMLRVGELVRHALVQLLQRGEVADPALDSVTVTIPEVRMSPDLKQAKVYVMPLGGTHADEVVEALNHHARFLRGRLGPLLDIKFTPELRFFVDDTFAEADRIETLLRSERVQRDLHHDEDEGE